MNENPAHATRPIKTELREAAVAARKALSPEEVEDASRGVAQQLVVFAPFLCAATILSYAPLKGEISPEPALALRAQLMGADATIAYPRVTGEREMEARITERQALEKGSFGVFEPNVTAVFLDPDRIDVVLVPGLVFNYQGFRIGYGKGFYDAYLARLRRDTVTIGLTYDEALVDALPFEVHDVAVDYLATPSRIITC